MLRNQKSAKCVEVAKGSTDDGALVLQNECNGTPEQKWELASLGGSNYSVRNVKSGKLLDVRNNGQTDTVQQWGTIAGAPSKQWSVLADVKKIATLKALSDPKECLDVVGGSMGNGARLQTFSCNPSGAQKFELISTPKVSTCWAGEAPYAPLVPEDYWPGVKFANPLEVVQEPEKAGNSFIVMEKKGKAYIMLGGVKKEFFDLGEKLHLDGESGLASMVFDPDYKTKNRYVYVTYISKEKELRLSRFEAPKGTEMDTATEVILFRVEGSSSIHRSGALTFGPGPQGKTYLYMAVGDDGFLTNDDPNRIKAAQMEYPNGKLLRLSEAVYHSNKELPWDFKDKSGTKNPIVAKGLRNTWRMSFDGDMLWMGNVGDNSWEEVNRFNVKTVKADSVIDFGWPFCEGVHCCDDKGGKKCRWNDIMTRPPRSTMTFPFYALNYREFSGQHAVIGGFVYRGKALPELYGKYVFGDHNARVIYSLDANANRSKLLSNVNVSDFGLDRNKEILMTGFAEGQVFRLAQGKGGNTKMPPAKLDDWKCFSSLKNGNPVPAKDVRPYDIAQRFWSDNADKKRFFALPSGARLNVNNPEDWILPPGGVTIKNFFWNKRIFETRFFVRHTNGQYAGYTYRWDGPNSATLVPTLVPANGGTKDLGDITWEYPTRDQCMLCHNSSAGGTLGLEARQFNKVVNGKNQISNLGDADLLTNPHLNLGDYPAYAADPDDLTRDLPDRARSYLHVNCASCHRGPQAAASRATWDARYTIKLKDMGVCNEQPFEKVSGKDEERIIAPGKGGLSTIWLRAHVRDTSFQMPPIASKVPDTVGTDMLKDWIGTLDRCP
ncbi:MAG TPA: RICIN domain-containing protein [Fibrobacteria bacterium]|nr:RICIN domain-containing protein [Fibrobacteria bacterium]